MRNRTALLVQRTVKHIRVIKKNQKKKNSNHLSSKMNLKIELIGISLISFTIALAFEAGNTSDGRDTAVFNFPEYDYKENSKNVSFIFRCLFSKNLLLKTYLFCTPSSIRNCLFVNSNRPATKANDVKTYLEWLEFGVYVNAYHRHAIEKSTSSMR